MKHSAWVSLSVLMILAMLSVPVSAHHRTAAYDAKQTISLKATITDFEFVNPHAQIFFDTKDDQGKVLHWSCESTNPAMLVRAGWTKTTLKAGDEVTMFVHPNRDPSLTVVSFVKVTLANGQTVDTRRQD